MFVHGGEASMIKNAVCPLDESVPSDASAVQLCEAAPFFPFVGLIDGMLAKKFVVEHHYLHTLPAVQTGAHFGAFSDQAKTKLVAVASYSSCHCPKVPRDFIELRRLVVEPGHHDFVLSRFLAATLRQLRDMGVSAVLSWADPEAGHHGGIYQATNWIFTAPDSWNWNSSFVTETGEIIGHRTAFKMFGTSSKKKVLKFRPKWRAFRPLPKYRYVMPLGIRKKKVLEILKTVELPYPKPALGIFPRTKELPRRKK